MALLIFAACSSHRVLGEGAPAGADYARGLYDRGLLWEAFGGLDRARELYREAATLAPPFVEAHLRYQDAARRSALYVPYLLREYREFLEDKPDDPARVFLYARLLGSDPAALAERIGLLEQAEKRSPRNYWIHRGLARAYREAGKETEAEVRALQAVMERPERLPGIEELAGVENLGEACRNEAFRGTAACRFLAAREGCSPEGVQKLTELADDVGLPRHWRGWAAFAAGLCFPNDPGAALGRLRLAARLLPDAPVVALKLGERLAGLGRTEEAREILTPLAYRYDAGPARLSALKLLAEIYEKQGDSRKAAELRLDAAASEGERSVP